MATGTRSDERRWIVLVIDGRFVSLGRASDPSEEEVCQAETALRAQGLSGWIAVMQGNPYVGPLPSLMEVRRLADPPVPFHDASSACVRAIAERRSEVSG